MQQFADLLLSSPSCYSVPRATKVSRCELATKISLPLARKTPATLCKILKGFEFLGSRQLHFI